MIEAVADIHLICVIQEDHGYMHRCPLYALLRTYTITSDMAQFRDVLAWKLFEGPKRV